MTDKPFGLNLLLPLDNPFSQATLEIGLEEKVPVFVTVGEAEHAVFERIKQSGARIIHRSLTPTFESMREAEKFGADILVTTVFDEGGVLSQQVSDTFTILPTMVDDVSIPVLAAGGINDAHAVKVALALGASGIYIGTRFLATKESPMASVAKDLMLRSDYKDLVFISVTQRLIATSFARRMSEQFEQDHQADTDKIIAQAGGLRTAMLDGNIEQGIISVNTRIGLIEDIPTVEALIHRLMTN